MTIETWPIDRPIPYARNARKIPQKAIDKVAASLKEFGWRQAIVVDKEGVIVVGHTRLAAAKQLGMTEVPVHVATELTDAQIKAYRLMDNRSHQESDWDIELLAVEMSELSALTIDLSLTGFDQHELDKLLMDPSEDEKANEAPELPEHPVSRLGDLWVCGKHRVMCGDATNADDVARLLGGARADMVWTDPPYSVNVTGGTHDPRDKKNYGKGPKIQNDSMSDSEFTDFLVAAFKNYASVMKPGAAIYVCHADTKGRAFRDAFELDSGFFLHAVIIWVKQQFVFGRSDYHWQHEPILYGWQKGAGHQFYGARNQSTTWTIDRPMRSALEHPTQKPVELPDRAIRNSSKQGDLVLDLFGGAGSTLIAADRLGRSAVLMELEPAYCDVIVTRWQNATGGQAALEANGQTFAALKDDRTDATKEKVT